MNINLARKWRSKQFDEIVGQPLAVRLVKNSLYRNLLFPVYLLSGTRGTGKTSMARIFAAALNCKQLKAFQEDPKNHSLPCLTCESCTAMQQMNHPDFIEIDAASHTGVDNVRQIIEAASFVPVLGGKKIYLIDEAHMLSKAAFNAFLKILEEPPESVVFMLVTTDPHKIIPTVISRCFQIFFDRIKPAEVVAHLTFICEQEGLSAEPEALMLIAQETEGCMRDALNLLERLRALPEGIDADGAAAKITKQAVSDLLGNVDDDRVSELLYTIVTGDAHAVLETWSRLEMTRFAPALVWKKLVETLRRMLWLKQAIAPDELPVSETLHKAVAAVSYERLIQVLDLCYSYELAFSRTSVPGTLLEVLMLKMVSPSATTVKAAVPPVKKTIMQPVKKNLAPASPTNIVAANPLSAKAVPVKAVPVKAAPVKAALVKTEPVKQPAIQAKPATKVSMQVTQPKKDSPVVKPQAAPSQKEAQPEPPAVTPEASQKKAAELPKPTGIWAECLAALEGISDPLVLSIFKQSTDHLYQEKDSTLEVTFSKDLLFFKEWLGTTETIWSPIIQKYYGEGTRVISKFEGASLKQRPIVMAPVKAPPPSQTSQKQAPASQVKRTPQRRARAPKEPVSTAVSQETVQSLETGSVVAEVFPGRMTARDIPSQEGV